MLKITEKIKNKFHDTEDRKIIFSGTLGFVATIIAILIIGGILSDNKVSGNTDSYSIQEEESDEVQTTVMLKETTTAAPETQTVTEIPTEIITVPPETVPAVVTPAIPQTDNSTTIIERETIPIQNIVVESNVQLEDDVVTEEKPQELSYEPQPSSFVSSADMAAGKFANCIDVSHHNGTIDWNAVKASGIDYAFIRVGYRGYEGGKIGKDMKFEENLRNAINAGVKVGVYFFSQAITEQEALEEASVTLNYIRNYDITLPVVIDWETSSDYRTYSGLSQNKLTNIVSVFCNTVASYGYTPMVYMNKSDLYNRVYYSVLAAKYKIWLAWYFDKYKSDNYASNRFVYGDNLPDVPFPYSVWQYSSKGSVNGISTRVDMNLIFDQGGQVYDPEINISKNEFITNWMSDIDLLEGVTAVNSNGNDAISNLTVSIRNTNGNEVSKQDAINTPGVYKITYTLNDINTVTANADLYVRNYPQIFFGGAAWSDYNDRTITYDYNNNLTPERNLDIIKRIFSSKISSCYWDKFEGYSDKIVINDAVYGGFENIIVNNSIQNGTYRITYYTDDHKGLNNARTINLVINKKEAQVSTDNNSTDVTGISENNESQSMEEMPSQIQAQNQ